MNCSQLAQKIEGFSPNSNMAEVARLTTLMLNACEDANTLCNPEIFEQVWCDVNIRLQAANDQHEAMTWELEDLAKSDPKKFTPDQIWILIRAIKVQSQILKMYARSPLFEVQ